MEREGVDRRTVLKTMGGLMASLGFGGFTRIVPHSGATLVPRDTLVTCVAVEYLGGIEYLAVDRMILELFMPPKSAIHKAVPTVQVNMTRAEELVMKEFLKAMNGEKEHAEHRKKFPTPATLVATKRRRVFGFKEDA